MRGPVTKEEKLTIIVAAVGILLLILLAIATFYLWNAANPPPRASSADSTPVAPDTIRPVIPVINPHNNVTEMYLRTNKADRIKFPQNLSDPYEANYVPLDIVRMHATIEMALLTPINSSGKILTSAPILVPVGDPTIVFDEITGKRVYYDFYSSPSPSNRAFVTVSATRLWGNSVFRAGFVNQDNEQMNLDKAQGYYDQNFPGYEIQSVRFVSGCWGQIVQMEILSPDSRKSTVNMDNWGIVDERRCGGSTDDIPQKEIPARIAKWYEINAEYQTLEDNLRTESINLSAPLSPDDAACIHWIITKTW